MSNPTKQNRKQIVIALVCLAVVAAALLVLWKTLAPKGEAGTKTITVQVVHAGGDIWSYQLVTQEAYLGPALVEGGVVEDNQGAYGLYILTAGGETVNEANQEWWKVTKGGARVDTGVDSTPIADGDAFELTFTVGYDGF